MAPLVNGFLLCGALDAPDGCLSTAGQFSSQHSRLHFPIHRTTADISLDHSLVGAAHSTMELADPTIKTLDHRPLTVYLSSLT